ncbi:MAG: HAD hydrolase family protein [Candidatus Pacebacteria bacterium]|nr:HAD hydrolase family protein [Candidatus Paceibacterota bacterium]
MKQSLRKKIAPQDLLKQLKSIRFIVFDFDGVFTDNRVLVLEDGREGVFCYRSDGLGIEILRKTGFPLLVLSKEKNPVVKYRCMKLRLSCKHGCSNKLRVLKEESKKLNIPLSQVAYMGNDINDVECIKAVGLAVAVADSYPEVKRLAGYVTKRAGGFGAIREFCDLILKARKG